MSSKKRAKTLNFHQKPERVEVIVNPAPTRKIPLLSILNTAFRNAGIRWDISVTHGDGDGGILANKALDAGVDAVAVYGGDGTVMEVAASMVGSEVPLLILGGGTGNLVAAELRLPPNLEKACQLLCGDTFQTRDIDVGMMGENPFLLRAGCGIEPGVVQEATRELKDKHGKWAYVYAALKTLPKRPVVEYELILDDKEVFRETGVSCVVANVGTVGIGHLTLSPSVSIEDGLLDVFFLRKVGFDSLTQLLEKMTGFDRIKELGIDSMNQVFEKMLGNDKSRVAEFATNLLESKEVSHWKVRSVEIRTKPPIDMQVDGDVVAMTPQRFEAMPGALRVVI